MTNIPFSKKEIYKKLQLMSFRGPDSIDVRNSNNSYFGHVRLAIIDLDNRSNQPMTYREFTIVFNGEIYNYKDIRRDLIKLGYTFNTESDTEVILKGYVEWGNEIVKRLNGMFAFVIYDESKDKLFCSRDRLGVKPFYYYWKDGQIEICSQLRPINIYNNLIINEEAISIYLDCTYIPSPFTIYNNVYKLKAGNNLEVDLKTKQLNISEYWNLKGTNELDISYDEAKLRVHDLLKDSVRIRLESDVPFGCFLSGGIDSSLISSIASKFSKNPINTFSIGFADPNFDESKLSIKYSEIIKSNHTVTICNPDDVLNMIPKLIEVYDEPFADSSALPTLLLNKITKQHVTMALSGDGGDESFLGYNHFDWIYYANKLLKVPLFIRRFLSFFVIEKLFGPKSFGIKKILNSKSIDDVIINVYVSSNSIVQNPTYSWLENYSEFKSLSNNPIQKDSDLNIKLWLENDSNVKVDRASMAFSVEVRSPFLDYRLVELARSLPVSYRYQKGKKKRILRDILKEYIPENIFNQPKKGFSVPIGKWIREELRAEFTQNLSDDFLLKVPNLNVQKFKKMFDSHLQGKNDFSSYIWRVYILSKWYQEFGYYKKPVNDD